MCRSSQTTDQLFGLILIEGHQDRNLPFRRVDPHLAVQGRHLHLGDLGVDFLARLELDGLRLDRKREQPLGHRDDDALGLCGGEAIALQGLAQFVEHLGERLRDGKGLSAVEVRMLFGLGPGKPEDAADDLRLPKETIEQQAMQGQVPGRQSDGQWRFLKAAIDEWLQSRDSRAVLLG